MHRQMANMLKGGLLVIILKILHVSSEPPSLYRFRNNAPIFSPTVPAAISNLYTSAIPSSKYGTPSIAPVQDSYGAPLISADQSSSNYGPPIATDYGPPSTPAPIIHKHVYVHIAPNEGEYTTPRKPIEVPPAQKHYRIVFIKAPTLPPPTAPQLPPIPQNEEKTIVYVLVKKPEEIPDIVLPTAPPTQPSKPEVYFIRYRTSQETTPAPSPSPEGYYKK